MWKYTDNEYVKLFRKMLSWEWYTDVNTKVLFIHCLLKANWKDTKWRGIAIQRGQFVTSLETLSKETGVTVRQLRTAVLHLEATGEVTSKRHAKFRIVTVNSYDAYQSSDKQNVSKSPTKRQGSDKQATTDIRTYKNNKEHKEEKEGAPPDYNPWDIEDTPEELEAWLNS